MPPAHEIARNHFDGARRIDSNRTRNDFAERVLRKAGRRRIDRGQTIGKRCIAGHDPELRMDDFETEMTISHFTEHAHAVALGERLLMARVKRKESQDELRSRAARRVVLDQADELASRPILDVGANDNALGLCRVTGAQVAERGKMRVILVT